MFFPADAPAERHSRALRALRFSMNAPVIALEGLPVGPARAAVALHPGAEPRVTIALRATRSGQTLFYCAGDELADFSSASVVVDAALSFAESMGFLFDDDEVEARGAEGPSQAAGLWAEFIDELPERPAVQAPARTAADPPVPTAAVRLRAAPAPAAASPAPPALRATPGAPPAAGARAPRPPLDDLSPLPATLSEELLGAELPRAPLAMLDDDGPADALPFWLLQPEPPRRTAPRPAPAAAPKTPPDPVQSPAAPLEAAASADPEIGLERRPSVPPRPRAPLPRRVEEPAPAVPIPGPPRAPRPQPQAPPQPRPQPQARSEPRPGAAVERPRPRSADAARGLHAVLAETGVDQLLQGARAPTAAKAARPGLSKFRFRTPAAAPRAAAPAPAVAREERGGAEPIERQEFESLSLRLRSRF